MARVRITEEQDLFSRFIRGADRMSNEQLADHIRIAWHAAVTLPAQLTAPGNGRRNLREIADLRCN